MQMLAHIIQLTCIYALIGVGYVLIYRAGRVINLAHGELMLIGAYFLVTTASLFSSHPWLALAASVLLALVAGGLVYLVLMRGMTGQAVLAAVLATIALGILLRGLATLIWKPVTRYPLQDLHITNPPVQLSGSVALSSVGLTIIATTVGVYLGLYVFFRHTSWGIRMRAVGQNPLLAAQRGIGLHAVYALAWGIGTLTGGLAGMLLALDAGVDGTMVLIGLKAFPAVLVGGLDSLAGALLGALLVATSEVLAIHYLDALVADVVPFLVLLLTLILRPWGILGTREELERV